MNYKIKDMLFGALVIGVTLGWIVDHRFQINQRQTLASEISSLESELNQEIAGNRVTIGYLNFFRVQEEDEFTVDDYQHHLEMLKLQFSRNYSKWRQIKPNDALGQ